MNNNLDLNQFPHLQKSFINSDLNKGWVTTKDDNHIFIGKDGKPAYTREQINEAQKETSKNKKYTDKQISNAKERYEKMLTYRTVESYDPEHIGFEAAGQRADYHNKIVSSILSGDKDLAKKWKLFFLNDEVKKDQKEEESKAKKEANKAASADILAPIKSSRRLGEFGKWLNTTGNPYRSEHFSKRYTNESVNAFLSGKNF